MDFIYPLTKSKWEEAKYSLRSLQNVEHGNIFIIGELPDYLNESNLTFIKKNDPYGINTSNMVRKLLHICGDKRVSDDFVLMNDDFYFLEPQEIKDYDMGTMRFHIKNRREDMYKKYLKTTRGFIRKKFGIKEPKSYELHYPIVINKKKFKKVFKKIRWENKRIVWRSVYGNVAGIESTKAKPRTSVIPAGDYKFLNRDDFEKIKGNKFISSPPTVPQNFKTFIQQKFPTKSIYEN